MNAGSAQEVPTPYGAARVTLHGRGDRLLLLGHGAGGGVDAPDLAAVRERCVSLGWQVGLVEQPYRVAGRRAPPPSAGLDAAWLTVVRTLRRRGRAGRLLVVGGRSSGARVAARTAAETGAHGVVALAFPLRPPGKAVTRAAELGAVTVPTLVVQGTRDAFGGPDQLPRLPHLHVHPVAGADHSFRARRVDGRTSAECVDQAAAAVAEWLRPMG